ncbi:MAG: thiamine diphosphokinase [Kiritimatiellae bacterium]|nr:thiamine diphosphokinase [Kiritimatiellia bacterium]
MARRAETVILAAGDFPPRGSEAFAALASAKRVVCCDGAAKAYMRRMKRPPCAIVGDFDSWRGKIPEGTIAVRVAEQETNDLEKAVMFCRSRGWTNPVILGATGKRDDHSLGNVFRAFALGLETLTSHGRFMPVEGKARIKTGVGAAVSVFATDPSAKARSRGLVWPLDGVRFGNLYCATLNRTCAATVEIETTKPLLVYVASARSPRSSSTLRA